VLAVLFLLPALSLAGIPPLPGFFAKLALVRAGIEAGSPILVAAMLGVSILTLYSMVKIWNEAFWKTAPAEEAAAAEPAPVPCSEFWRATLCYTPVLAFAVLIVLSGIAAAPLFEVAQEAARQLDGNTAYLRAVLGDAP
jgi:multicomponent Na+:H+ antiporter subunit D